MAELIHESAIVDAGAKIGSNTKIWHFTHVMPKAIIGSDCVLGQNVFVGDRVVIGDRVKIQNNVSLYDGIACEDDVFIGPSAVFTNVANPRSFIERKDEFKTTILKKGSTIGANATIVCGCEIGEYAFIGAGCVVIDNVPSYAMIVGNPGRQIGWISLEGYKLNFDSEGRASCSSSGEVYEQLSDMEIKRIVD